MFYWKKTSTFPLSERQNIIGVVVSYDLRISQMKEKTLEILIMQPDAEFILLVIKCGLDLYGI